MKMECNYKGSPISINTDISVEYINGLPWPLQVGKEFETVETSITTYSTSEETTTETEIISRHWEIVQKVNVSVPAGNLTCFKIDIYNEDEELVDVWWYSDEVESDVKTLDVDHGEIEELLTYFIK